jgi:hypothetical protein
MVVMLKVTGLKQSSVNMTPDSNFNTGQEQSSVNMTQVSNFNTGQEQSSVNMSERHIRGSNCNNRQKQSSVIQQTHVLILIKNRMR